MLRLGGVCQWRRSQRSVRRETPHLRDEMWGTRRLKRQKQIPFGNDKQERGLGEAEALGAFDA